MCDMYDDEKGGMERAVYHIEPFKYDAASS